MITISSKTLIRELKEILLIGIFGILVSISFCWDCWKSWELFRIYAVYSCGIWILLWKGNAYLTDFISIYISWLEEPVKRLIIGILGLVIYSMIAITLFNYFFYVVWLGYDFEFFLDNFFTWAKTAMIITIIIATIMHAIGFLQGWKESILKAERYKQESLTSQFEALKNQVNPHFLFNSLNALTGLVYKDQDSAAKFIKELSEVYRYVLDNKGKEIVTLEQELGFVKAYIYLQKIRYKEKLQVNINIKTGEDMMLAPLCLQMLLENAIKHNIISDEKPLLIDLFLENEDYLVVKNNKQIKLQEQESSGVGLANISSRYAFLTDREVQVTEDTSNFTVKIPLLRFQ